MINTKTGDEVPALDVILLAIEEGRAINHEGDGILEIGNETWVPDDFDGLMDGDEMLTYEFLDEVRATADEQF